MECCFETKRKEREAESRKKRREGCGWTSRWREMRKSSKRLCHRRSRSTKAEGEGHGWCGRGGGIERNVCLFVCLSVFGLGWTEEAVMTEMGDCGWEWNRR